MSSYQVWIIERPQGWIPRTPDDVPLAPRPQRLLAETAALLPAVQQAIAHNEQASSEHWAVVVCPSGPARHCRAGRLCTPLSYKVAAVWWPSGWEPQSPLDVPRCMHRAAGESQQEALTYPKAVATAEALNRQSIDQDGALWYVVVAVENEPVSTTTSCDPAGTETTVEVRKLHVVRPEGGGAGDCGHCPAHSFSCPDNAEQVETSTRVAAPRA